MRGSPLWNICWKGGARYESCAASGLRASGRVPRPSACVFSGEILSEPVTGATCRAAAAPDGGGVCRRRTDLPPLSVPHGGGAGGPRAGGSADLYQNAAYFPLEIGNYRPECMRGIRLYQQHLPRRQRGAPDLRAGYMAGAVALSERGHFLQCGLLAVHGGGVLPIHPRCTHDGGGRPFRADVVCVLGTAPDIYPAQYRYDPTLSGNAPDRACLTGLHRVQHRAADAAALFLCDLPADGCQPEPQRKAPAGKPASDHAAAAVRKPESCHRGGTAGAARSASPAQSDLHAGRRRRHGGPAWISGAERITDPQSGDALLRKQRGGQRGRLLLRAVRARGDPHSCAAGSAGNTARG